MLGTIQFGRMTWNLTHLPVNMFSKIVRSDHAVELSISCVEPQNTGTPFTNMYNGLSY